jgi:hypothetical protein
VWSKAGRFVEGLHVVGGVTTASKISINVVLNLYVMLDCDTYYIIMHFIVMMLTVDFINSV